jgi:hypothetical protein
MNCSAECCRWSFGENQVISIVTFNIDLLIEATLEILTRSRPGRWTLQRAYGFNDPLDVLTGPGEDFPTEDGPVDIPLYKMHGSVNWLFRTRDYYPPADLMAQPRKIWLLSDRIIGTRRASYQPPRGRRWPLFPLIVPPVYEKHLLIRNNLGEVWSSAHAALLDASRVVFWGYSFPSADTHARHFFQSLSDQNVALKSPVLINPDPAAAQALWAVLRPRQIEHYQDALAYLGD